MAPTDPKSILFAYAGTPRETEVLEALTELNYRVIPASGFEEAAEISSREAVGLLVASVSDPIRGFDLCAELRARPNGQGLRVLLTCESPEDAAEFDTHRSGEGAANGYIRLPVPTEDVIDSIERLIGLPSPPPEEGERRIAPPPAVDPEAKQLKRQVEELQEQIQFYKEQAREISITGEKNVRDVTAAVTDLKGDLEKAQGEKESLRDELALLKSTAAHQERDVAAKERLLKDLKTEGERKQAELLRDVEELRKTLSEADQKHKKALGALREFYKGKTGNAAKLEKRIAELEDELKKSTDEEARLAGELAKARELLAKVRSVFS